MEHSLSHQPNASEKQNQVLAVRRPDGLVLQIEQYTREQILKPQQPDSKYKEHAKRWVEGMVGLHGLENVMRCPFRLTSKQIITHAYGFELPDFPVNRELTSFLRAADAYRRQMYGGGDDLVS